MSKSGYNKIDALLSGKTVGTQSDLRDAANTAAARSGSAAYREIDARLAAGAQRNSKVLNPNIDVWNRIRNEMLEQQKQDDLWSLANDGLGFGEAAAWGGLSGLWSGVTGGIDAAAGRAAYEVNRASGENILKNVAGINEYNPQDLIGRLKGAWAEYDFDREGVVGLAKRLKDSAFGAGAYAVEQYAKNGGFLNYIPGGQAAKTGISVFNYLVKNVGLPAITGSNNAEENAKWFSDQAYGLSGKATDAVASLPGMSMIDSNTYQAALQQSDKPAQIAGKVTQVLGRMVPTIAMSYAGHPTEGLLAMSVGAGGQAAREAYEQGASEEDAYYIGVMKGLTEYGTERMFDAYKMFGDSVMSKGMRRLLKDAALTKLGRAIGGVGEILGENIEEGASDWAAPEIEKAVLGRTLEGTDDNTFAQAFLGQAPWTEDGLVTLLTTVLLNGMGNVVQNGIRTVSKEDVSQIAEIARKAGSVQLEELANEYEKAAEKRGKLGAGKYNTLYEATKDRVGDEEFTRQMRQSSVNRYVNENGTEDAKALFNSQAFSEENRYELTDAQAEEIVKAYDPNGEQRFGDYLRAMREAYSYGAKGLSADAMFATGTETKTLSEPQAKIAWALGRGQQNASADTVDVKTDEGRQKAIAAMKALGDYAEEAADTVTADQDLDAAAAAMNKAVNLYAAIGGDLQQAYQDAKDGKTANIIRYLTPAQIAKAQEIGEKVKADRAAEVQRKTEAYEGLRQAAEEMESGTPEITDLNATIADARQYIAEQQSTIGNYQVIMEQLRSGDPNVIHEAEYQRLVGEVAEMQENIRGTEEMIRDLTDRRNELRKQHPGKRKKGTVSFAGGTIEGTKYEGVDESKLTRQQKKAVAAAQVIADAIGIDVVFFDGEKEGSRRLGAWQGDTLFVSINSSIGSGESTRFIAGATMSHELTHFQQQYDPQTYQELKNYVVGHILKTNAAGLEELVRQQMNMAPQMSYDRALDEVVANACQTMLMNSKAVTELARENMNLAEKIADVLEEIAGRIRAAFEEVDPKDGDLFRTVRMMEGQLDQMQEIWDRALRNAAANYQATEAVKQKVTDNGVQYSQVQKDEILHLKEQLRGHQDELNKMEPLANVTSGIQFDLHNMQKAVQWVGDQLGLPEDRKQYKQFYREGIEPVNISRKRVNTAFNYLPKAHDDQLRTKMGQAYTTAAVAIPEVIEKGIDIENHENHKGDGYPTITLAGPVVIDGERGNLAVVLKRTTGMFYKVHSALTPEGDLMTIDTSKEAEALTGGASVVEDVAPAMLSAKPIVTEVPAEVNTDDLVGALEAVEASGAQNSRFVEDEKTLNYLNRQEKAGKVVHTYKSFLEVRDEDGNVHLLPPMASLQKDASGKWNYAHTMEVGRWEESVGDPSKIIIDPKNGKGYYMLKKDNGKTVKAAYNPYQHSSNLMLNDQFSEAYQRPKLATYECIIPESELTSGYQADHAKNAVGRHPWKAGIVAGKIARQKGLKRDVYLSRWLKPLRRVPDAEVAQHYKELLAGTDIAVPSNVVPPSLLHALEDAGVKIEYTKEAPKVERTADQMQSRSTQRDVELLSQIRDAGTQNQVYAFENDREGYEDLLRKWGGMTDREIRDLFKTVDAAMEKIKKHLDALDYAWDKDINDRAYSPVKNNSDELYKKSIDFSTLCRKRILQQTVAAKLSEALDRAVTQDEYIAIRDALMALQAEGKQIEVACALCYVESARLNTQRFVNNFLENRETEMRAAWKNPAKLTEEQRQAVEDAKALPTTMFTTPDGLQQLKKNYPKVHAAFIMRTAGLMKSKSIENDVWWRLGDAKKVSDALIKQMNAENGLRTQSWSDFQVKHLMDYIAATIELAARGAKMHAYTKVLDYVRLMGNTGVMINMSLIPKASYNGKLEYDPVEGINYEEAVKLREQFPETAGTICIGIRPKQIRQLMEDMTVDYIIPYHRSGASPVIRERMHIPEWDDFQGNQSEKKLSGEAAEENAKKYGVKLLSESDPNWHKGPKFSDWFDLKKAKQAQKRLGTKGKYGVMTGGYMAMQQAAENYKRICAERGLQPKFSYGVNEKGESLNVSDAPNYWKVLIDRKMVNNKTGGIIEQKAIKPVFDMDTVQKILDDELERYPQVKADQDEALNRVVDSFLKGDVNGNMSADEVAKALQKPIENLAEVAVTGSQNQMAGPREDWALAADITEQVKKELVGYDGITEAEIDDWLDPDAYFRANGGSLFYKPEEVMDELYALTREKPGKKAGVYRLMDRILRTMRPVMEYVYTDENGKTAGFAKWYNKRNPSVYYPGYRPGDLFDGGWYYGDEDARRNQTREIEYLTKLVGKKGISEETRAEAQEFLDRLTDEPKEWTAMHNGEEREYQEVFYQQVDDSFDDTQAESEGRELAQTRIQSEAEIINSMVESVREMTKAEKKSLKAIQDRLKINKTPEVREQDARKLARAYIRSTQSTLTVDDIAPDIKALGDYIAQTEDISPAAVNEMARGIASKLVNTAQVTVGDSTEDETMNSIRDRIRGSKLYISNTEGGDIPGFENLNEFRKKNFGRFSVVDSDSDARTDDHVGVDSFYEEMRNSFGDYYFPELTNQGEMLGALAGYFDAAAPTVNPHAQYIGEVTADTALDLVRDVLSNEFLLLDLETLGLEPMNKAERLQLRNRELGEKLKELEKEKKLSEREVGKLYNQIAKLNQKLADADAKYANLKQKADERLAQVQAEGTARALEKVAKEKERSAKKIQALKDHYAEMEQRARERREESAGVSKYRAQIEKKAKKLYELLMTNSDQKHVPEVLKGPLAEFLKELDFTSKRQLRGGEETKKDQTFAARLLEMEKLLSNPQAVIEGSAEGSVDLGGYIDVSQDNLQYLRDVAGMITTALKENRDFTINSMSASQLKGLSNFLSNLYTAINMMNSFMANARYENIREAAKQDIGYMNSLGQHKPDTEKDVSKFTKWKNGVPFYIFRRFGEGGRSIFDAFTRGWERLAFHAQEIIAFTEGLYSDKEVREWKDQVHDIRLTDGSEIKMTTAQIMELSVLLNREQAQKHIQKGGIRVGDIDQGRKGVLSDQNHYHLTDMDIINITGLLTARQVEVAKALQQFMARKGAEWGNEISMRRFGYNFYTEGDNYYPIKTDNLDRPTSDTDLPENASMFRLLNLSASKSLNPKASNALIVGNIFDTFSDHMADMAKLNGMGLPVLDAIKWFNFKERTNNEDGTYDTSTMQAAMEFAYGKAAGSYFRTLMKDINGATESGDRGLKGFGKLLSSYKIAAVGANLRVALLQPTSYVRATAVIKPQYLFGVMPSRQAYKEAMQYSGTAVWKSLGYYETDISRSLRGQIQHDDTWKDKVAEASMSLAELGDQMTWSRLWTACKRQVKAEQNLSGEALMQATADLFREAIYASQVMDSTLTRSEVMRGKGMYDKLNSAFMAEPTLSYNILMDAFSQYSNDIRANGKAGAWQRNAGKIGKAFTVYAASAVYAAIMESLMDALRDDDDDDFKDKFLEKFLGEGVFDNDKTLWQRAAAIYGGNLAQDLSLLGKIPFVKNIISKLQGYDNTDMTLAFVDRLIDVYKIATGQGSKRITAWGKLYKVLQPISEVVGLPISNLTRDVVAVWNATVGAIRPEWKLRKYDAIAMTDEMKEGYDTYVAGTGISFNQYKRILAAANTDGNTSVKQDELYAYLQTADLTQEQKEAVWASKGWKTSMSDFRAKEEKTAAQEKALAASGFTQEEYDVIKAAANTDGNSSLSQAELNEYLKSANLTEKQKDELWNLQGWKTSRSEYKPKGGGSSGSGTKPASTSIPVYSSKREATMAAKPAGMSEERYAEILRAADLDGNSSLKQDELGAALKRSVERREMSHEEAARVWASQGWSANHSYEWWLSKH